MDVQALIGRTFVHNVTGRKVTLLSVVEAVLPEDTMLRLQDGDGVRIAFLDQFPIRYVLA